MMNPSVASEHSDDRTVARTRSFSALWRYGGVIIVNTMAYRATDQSRLTTVTDPIGPENYRHILEAAQKTGAVVAAYGTPKDKALLGHGPDIIARLLTDAPDVRIMCLKTSIRGRPVHPLYLASDTPLKTFRLPDPS